MCAITEGKLAIRFRTIIETSATLESLEQRSPLMIEDKRDQAGWGWTSKLEPNTRSQTRRVNASKSPFLDS
jgi:hypothetical protein